jgi:hypothetical protein
MFVICFGTRIYRRCNLGTINVNYTISTLEFCQKLFLHHLNSNYTYDGLVIDD